MLTYKELLYQDRVFGLGEDLVEFYVALFKDMHEPVVWLSRDTNGSFSIVTNELEATRFENVSKLDVPEYHQFITRQLGGEYHSNMIKPRTH